MVVAWGLCFFLAAFRRVVQLPALLCCEAMVWALTFLAFPLRMLTAVDRERKLGSLIGEMQAQMEDLVWVNRELQEKLQAALREHDALLDEMEDEQEDAYARIDALEAQLKALRQENMRLNEHKGKSMWDNKQVASLARHGNDDKKPSESDKKQDKTPRPRVASEAAVAGTTQDGLKPVQPADPDASVLSLTAEESMARQANDKAVARRRSLFSLGMSLAVGGVACSADAACLPLLAGLFAVVGVSMRSVSRCCPRRGDAVSLLSLNWFLLGVLTSPMLPAVARAGRALGPAFASLT
ncbi:unnamed protein product [Urochloa decumbens]|uniref:Uncharacterized protein n=1 Tax=Urochloa decumbens TaxID=240449 RepID=A0ABC8YLV6_9POAL